MTRTGTTSAPVSARDVRPFLSRLLWLSAVAGAAAVAVAIAPCVSGCVFAAATCWHWCLLCFRLGPGNRMLTCVCLVCVPANSVCRPQGVHAQRCGRGRPPPHLRQGQEPRCPPRALQQGWRRHHPQHPPEPRERACHPPPTTRAAASLGSPGVCAVPASWPPESSRAPPLCASQQINVVEQTGKKGGRRISRAGQQALDRIAFQVASAASGAVESGDEDEE